MQIKYYKKNIYGVTLMYIHDRRLSMTIGMLTGKKTVDQFDLQSLEKLGHTCIEVLESEAQKI